MKTNLTEQQEEVDTQRLIFGWYRRSFSRPRVRELADRLVDLDLLDACRLAAEIDEALGAAASNKILAKLSSPIRSQAAKRIAINQTKTGS